SHVTCRCCTCFLPLLLLLCSILFSYTTLFRSRFDGVRFGVRAENTQNMIDMMEQSRGQGFGDEVKKRIIFGTYAQSLDHETVPRSEEHTSELQSRFDLVCRLLLEKKKKQNNRD